ncbi:hypothetical protein PENTCL1PPCAC_9882, partial [Pristionchus entomophagus]
NLSFSLSPGEYIALVGKSGCGKSTTLKLVTRFLSADHGRLYWMGNHWRDTKRRSGEGWSALSHRNNVTSMDQLKII